MAAAHPNPDSALNSGSALNSPLRQSASSNVRDDAQDSDQLSELKDENKELRFRVQVG